MEQTTQLILVLYTGLGVDETALIRDRTVASHKDVICDCLAEDLHLENIGDDLFRFAINVWVYDGNVVVARDDIA